MISRADMTKPWRPNYSETTAALGNFGNRRSESKGMCERAPKINQRRPMVIAARCD